MKTLWFSLFICLTAIYAEAQRCDDSRFPTLPNGRQAFDLSVSLYKATTSEERVRYEEVLQAFAQAVYEMSNGGHVIRNVDVYELGAHSEDADVIWGEYNSTAFSNVGGMMKRAFKIYMFDDLDEYNLAGVLQRHSYMGTALDRQGLGYTMAHEFGHYAYSMFDEYVGGSGSEDWMPQSTDVATQNAVMNNQWNAMGGFWQWLNFSTSHNASTTTAQWRMWGMSSWDLLESPCATNPHSASLSVLDRYVYTGVSGRAPDALDVFNGISWMRVELNDASQDPLQEFDVNWISNDVDMELVLDVSNSMTGQPIADVITAAQYLVDFLPLGNSNLGITTFSSFDNPSFFPLTALLTQADKSAAKNAIAALSASGQTAMYDGAESALLKLQNFQVGTSQNVQMAFLLSDGDDNASSATESSVISAYSAANVPLNTIGYGNGNFHQTLENLANGSGGTFYSGIHSSGELLAAYIDAYAAAASLQMVPVTYDGGIYATAPFNTVDNRLIESEVVLSAGATPLVDVYGPNGQLAVTTLVRTAGATPGTELLTTSIDASEITRLGTGTYQIVYGVLNGTISISSIVSYVLPSAPRPMFVLALDLNSSSINYPEPLVISASISREMPVTNVVMNAQVVSPSGQVIPVEMTDDGQEADLYAGDGVYSGYLSSYTEDGEYELVVDAFDGGTAQFVASTFSLTQDGSYIPPTTKPVHEAFARRQISTFTIAGVQTDDHSDLLESGTLLGAENQFIAGKIDFAGDQDCFRIQEIPLDIQTLSIRVFELGAGMQPEVEVYNGTTGMGIASANIRTKPSKLGYLLLEIPVSGISELQIKVKDMNADSFGGVYKIDAGPALISDQATLGDLKVKTLDQQTYSSNLLAISVVPENVGSESISDFVIKYYLHTEHYKVPVLEPWYSAFATVSLEELGEEQYAVVFDFSGTTLAGNSVLPIDPSNVVGIHYDDWSDFDKNNDFSNLSVTTSTINPKVALFDQNGKLLFGETPFIHGPRQPEIQVNVWGKEAKTYDSKWSAPQFSIQNQGDEISDFQVHYYFSSAEGKTPVLEQWTMNNATVSMHDLGGYQWKLVFDYAGFTLPVNANLSLTEVMVGLRYSDWSDWNTADDYSAFASATETENDRIVITNSDGEVLWGVYP